MAPPGQRRQGAWPLPGMDRWPPHGSLSETGSCSVIPGAREKHVQPPSARGLTRAPLLRLPFGPHPLHDTLLPGPYLVTSRAPKPLVPHRAGTFTVPCGWLVLVTMGTAGQPFAHTPPLRLPTALQNRPWRPHLAREDSRGGGGGGSCPGSQGQLVLRLEPQALTVTLPQAGPSSPTDRTVTRARVSLGWPPDFRGCSGSHVAEEPGLTVCDPCHWLSPDPP